MLCTELKKEYVEKLIASIEYPVALHIKGEAFRWKNEDGTTMKDFSIPESEKNYAKPFFIKSNRQKKKD